MCRQPLFLPDRNRLPMTLRSLSLISLVALGLAACGGGDEQANNTVNIDQAVLSDDLAANDVTAIDAVTGDAANMAADVDINFTNDMLESSGNGADRADSAKPRPRRSSPAPATNTGAPAAEPTTNATTNATE
jgi:hypothetical protein